MAAATPKTPDVEKTAAPVTVSRQDHIVLPSISKDGTVAEHDPVFIGDEEGTREAVREQFRQNAVSASDHAHQREQAAAAAEAEAVDQDPAIQARIDEHQKVAKAAEKAADKLLG